MRLLVNGVQGTAISHILSSDTTLNLQFLNDDGSPIDISAPGVATLELFSTPARTDTPATVLAVSVTGSSVSGFGSAKIEDTVTSATLARGTQYRIWGKFASDAGSGPSTLVQVASVPSILVIV
jgi:hypothetical protein